MTLALAKEPHLALAPAEIRRKILDYLRLNFASKVDDKVESLTVSFRELGGSTVEATLFWRFLRESLGVTVPFWSLRDPLVSIQKVVDLFLENRNSETAPDSTSFESVHGPDRKIIQLDHLSLEAILLATPNKSRLLELNPLNNGLSKAVLLTGANGYLARFLVLDLLAQTKSIAGRVFCLIRANDHESAFSRLLNSFGPGGGEFAGHLRLNRQMGRLVVLAGDAKSHKFGLLDSEFESLCEEVDTVIHNATQVNHLYKYKDLYEANVLGTIELMRFCLTKRLKAITYLSTYIVSCMGGKINEKEILARELCNTNELIEPDYGSGYLTCKWVCEELMRQLNETYGVPVIVFRPSMMLGHSRFIGYINTGDYFTRLLYSIARIGLAPKSFYATDGIFPYDGEPVDFVSSAIAAISCNQKDGFSTYHLCNPHVKEAASFDKIVDWIESSGYAVERLENYADWFSQFTEALEELPVEETRYSSLALMGAVSQPSSPILTCHPESAKFLEALRKYSSWNNPPPLTEPLIHKWLRDLVHLGILKKSDDQTLKAVSD